LKKCYFINQVSGRIFAQYYLEKELATKKLATVSWQQSERKTGLGHGEIGSTLGITHLLCVQKSQAAYPQLYCMNSAQSRIGSNKEKNFSAYVCVTIGHSSKNHLKTNIQRCTCLWYEYCIHGFWTELHARVPQRVTDCHTESNM
jgi:hypothetical protein